MTMVRSAYELIPPEYTYIFEKQPIRPTGMENYMTVMETLPHSAPSVVKILSRSNTMALMEATSRLHPEKSKPHIES